MAVFPDRIVFKTSRDSSAEILSATGSGGDDQIVDGEIVLGLESGKVKLYARDGNGQVISVLPDPPGYNISGNSIYDLSDVTLSAEYTPADGKVLTYLAGQWVARYVLYEDIYGAPNSLNDLDNPGNTFMRVGYNYLKDLLDVNNDVDRDELVGGEYLQFNANTKQWDPVLALTFDISANSIFDLGDVSKNFNPSSVRPYLVWDTGILSYVPGGLDIETDLTPTLGGNLNIAGKGVRNTDGLKISSYDSKGPQIQLDQDNATDTTLNLPIGVTFKDKRSFGFHTVRINTAIEPEVFYDEEDAYFYHTEEVNLYLPSVNPGADNKVLKYDNRGQAAWENFDLDALTSVQINPTTLVTGSVIAYDFLDGKWKNQLAPPADLTGSSIGQLSDVDLDADGNFKIDNLNSITFEGPGVPPEDTNKIDSVLKGFSFGQFRTTDGLGSYVYAHRDNGIELNSSSAVVRLTGDPLLNSNTPTLRWERSDYVANPELAPYVELQLSAGHVHQMTYQFPTVKPEAGQALFSDVEGNLSWDNVVVDFDGALGLGELNDVDLTTPVPLAGMVLTYTGDTEVGWVARTPDEQIGRLAELQDVNLEDLADKDFLRWDAGTARWRPSVPEKDWMIESVVQFFSGFSSATTGTIPVGKWRLDTPVLAVATELAISKYSASGLDMTSQMAPVYTAGRQILFESQEGDGHYFMCTIEEVLDNAGAQIVLAIVVDAYEGIFSLDDRFVVSLVGGGGTGGGSGGGVTSMEELIDTDISSLALKSKAVLEWDKLTATWKEGIAIARDLDELPSVDLSTTPPEVGEGLTWNGAKWVPGAGSAGATGASVKATDRVTLSTTAAAIGPGVDRTISVTSLGSSGNFLSIEVDKAAWVRCYSSLGALTADASRSQEDDPILGDGVLLEFITGGPRASNITPGTVYFNSESTAETQGNIYFAVRNLGEAVEDIALTVVAYAAVVTSITKGRTTIVTETPQMPGGSAFNGTLEGTGKMGSFLSTTTSVNSWITFYTSSEARDNDATRNRDTTPSTGSGVLLELITRANVVYEITPQRGYFNNDAVPQDRIYYKIVNESTTQQTISITTAIVPLEGQILNAITGSVTTINGGTFG